MEKLTEHQKKKVDTKEFLDALVKLPEEEKYKIFYMVKGMELMNKNGQSSSSA